MTKGQQFTRAVVIYAISRLLEAIGTIIALLGHHISTGKVLYYSLIWSQVHDDSSWFAAIASKGYWMQDTPFFPLYPLIIGGLHRLGVPVVTGGLIVSNCFMIADIYLIISLAREVVGKGEIRTAIIWALFPAAVYLSSMYSESIFVFGIVGGLLFIKRRRFWVAALFGVIASASRNEGVLLVIPALFEVWEIYKERQKLPWRQFVAVCIMPLGLAVYCIYLWVRFGNPLMFSHMEILWGRKMMLPPVTVYMALKTLPHIWTHNGWYGHIYYAAQYGAVFLGLASLPIIWRYLPRGWFWLCLCMVLMPLSDPGIGVQVITLYDHTIMDYFFSFDRFLIPMIPVFFALSIRMQQIKRAGWIVYPATGGGLVLMSICMSSHLFMG